MKNNKSKKFAAAGAALLMLLSMTGCGTQKEEEKAALQIVETTEKIVPETTQAIVPETTESVISEKEAQQIAEPAEEKTEAATEVAAPPEFSTDAKKTEKNKESTSTQNPAQTGNNVASSTGGKTETENSTMPSTGRPVENNSNKQESVPEKPNTEANRPNQDITEDQIVETWKAFTLEAKQLTMTVGQKRQMDYTYPGAVEEMRWISENESVLTVDAFGCMTAHAEGTARVVVFTEVYGARYCDITVLPKPLTAAEKDAEARAIAAEIAYIIMNDPTITTDLQRIAYAARFVNEFVRVGHTSSFHEDCRTAYGTFVAGYSNCVGSTKATGLVLEYMGYSWSHVNQGQDTHQWCQVYGVDDQTAFCDGSSYGVVGYGSRQADGSNWLYMNNAGELVAYN